MVGTGRLDQTHVRERLGVSSPGDQLLRGDEINVGEGEDGVDELQEAVLAVGPVEEPGGVEEQWEGGLALGVMLQEVLGKDLLDGVGVLIVEAAVRHGAGAASVTGGQSASASLDRDTNLTSLRVFMGTSHIPGWDSLGQGLTEQLWGILYSREYGQEGDSVGMEES